MAESARTLGRRRRSMLVVIAVVAGLVVAGAAVRTSRPPQRSLPVTSVDRNINDYVLFATDSIQVKGGSGTHVNGGHVGVNRRDPVSFDQEANLAYCVNGQTTFAPGVQIVADTVKMSEQCEGGDVFANKDIGSEWPLSNSYTLGGITFPIVASMPVFPTFADTCTNGAKDATVRNGETSDQIGVGAWTSFRDVSVRGTMFLKPNTTYTFCNLKVSGGRIMASPTTVINVVQTLTIDGGTVQMGANRCQDHPNLSNYMRIYVQGKGQFSDDTTVSFGKYSEIWAHVWAPRGKFQLGHSTELHGKAWGQSFTSDHGVEINPCPITVPTTTTTLPSVTTTKPPATTTSTTKPPATTTSTTRPPVTTTSTTRPPVTTTSTTNPPATTSTTKPPTATTSTTKPPATTTTTTLPDG